MQADVTATIAGWHGALAQIGSLGEALVGAIEGDNLPAAIATMMELRRSRTDIERVEVARSSEGASVEMIDALRTEMERVRAVDSLMHTWLTRSLPADAQLLGSGLGVAVIADAMLPAAWDFERDVAILVGDELAPVAQLLVDIGQRRVVIVGEAAEVPGDVIVVRDHAELVQVIAMMVPNPPTQLALRATDRADLAMVDTLVKAAHEAVCDHRVQNNTLRSFARTWIEQGATNIPTIARWPSVDAIGDRFAGLPMVIVAPGPSLARNAHRLKELKGKAVICAVSHALKAVLAAGVQPDVVITVDPQDIRYHYAGCDLSQTYLVQGATTHPGLFALPAKGGFTCAASGSADSWLYDAFGSTPALVGGGSVATTAFSLAMMWKCDPVVFVGLDLSFPGGQYYVSSSSDGDARAEIAADGTMKVAGWSPAFHAMKAHGGPQAQAERVVELPAWEGHGTVPSSFMLAAFHRWFVGALRHVRSNENSTTFYNCTEGGSFIEGMNHVPLAEVIASLGTTFDPQATLDETFAATDAAGRTVAAKKQVAGYVSGMKRARQLAVHAQNLLDRGASERELQRAERALATAMRPLTFCSLLAQEAVNRADAIAVHHGENYTAASRSLFGAVIDAVDQLTPVLAAAEKRL